VSDCQTIAHRWEKLSISAANPQLIHKRDLFLAPMLGICDWVLIKRLRLLSVIDPAEI